MAMLVLLECSGAENLKGRPFDNLKRGECCGVEYSKDPMGRLETFNSLSETKIFCVQFFYVETKGWGK